MTKPTMTRAQAEKRVGSWEQVGYRAWHYVETGTGRIIGSVDGEYRSYAAHQNMTPGLWVQLGSYQSLEDAKRAVVEAARCSGKDCMD